MTVRYINLRVPKSVTPGRVLCHNHIQHGPNTPCGVNGFRAWTESEVPKGFVKCRCNWSGLLHYARRDHVTLYGKDGKRKDGRDYAHETTEDPAYVSPSLREFATRAAKRRAA
jgi:hypothetical protein